MVVMRFFFFENFSHKCTLIATCVGRALEEVRSSLFSKIRSLGGGKRQQTSLGPPVALAFNFLVSVSIILMNKLVGQLFLSHESD